MTELEKISQGFGLLAPVYDRNDDENEIMRWMRRRVWQTYLGNFSRGDYILELNCGTGLDALFLAQQGIRVLATDISPVMLEYVKTKARDYDCGDLITTRILPFHEIIQLSGERFDGVISNFGGLNCLPDLSSLVKPLADIVKPGGSCILCLMPKFCLLETAAFLMRANFSGAFRRLRKSGTQANIGGYSIMVFYYTPKHIIRLFSQYFQPQRVYGLGIFLPPSYAVRFYRKHKVFFHTLLRLENVIADKFPFYNIGDYFVIEFVRHNSRDKPKP